ncbi:unnamed protein product (macronuclear) [Paramecium tetraurelia]|uniref:Uncharacterized protein n=1 Tax=Paramecium tetraurelia TaxID=5888 RepID=A0C4V2_PARTE|nr:uncharacterized protein GSPATT00006318001 [Paramecium tetraurelia]CAK65819.1 unnamed protein product [Paramecium tetraurelia]|eukprot:XP_001433216.1 hypothetical protein (macronuclear) [Paramecium tetraurelia strain d4-2]
MKNNTIRKCFYFNNDDVRKDIKMYCEDIMFYSVALLEFFYDKKGEFSPEELNENFPDLRNKPLLDSVRELWLALQGRLHTFSVHLRFNDRISRLTQSIVRPIFMEEAELVLQQRQKYGCLNSSLSILENLPLPNLEHSQYTIDNDETRDSENDLSQF